MKLVTLGGLELAGAAFARAKPLLLLAHVALEGTKDRRYLVDLFWPHAADSLNSLAAALKQLRRYAPGAIESDHLRVASALECDATTFLQVADAGHYEEALELYHGPFLSGVYLKGWSVELEEWVYGTREYLASRARQVLLSLGETIAAKGRFEEAVKYAETAYVLPGAPELEPDEATRLHTLLAAGNSSQLGRLRKDARGFGSELSLSTAEAQDQLRRLPSSKLSPTVGQTLPTRGTSFIGRDVELVEVANHLARPDCSLLTLTGPGGVGKSRLAVRIAHDLNERYSGGVYFVPLEALTDASLIPSSIGNALGLISQGRDDPLVQVAHCLGNRSSLLVLDNYEHLLEGAVVAARLLHACPNLKLLVTSRERLNLEEEWVLPLEGFAIPAQTISLADAAQYDALRLFEERAKRARLSFGLTVTELSYVVSICKHVEGMPLGIELAAAWVKLLTCQEIAQEIRRTIDFLSSSSRSLPERHKSIRAVFEGSWRLLTSEEQGILRRLSVFRGGFTKEAAGSVVGASLATLAALAEKSFLERFPSGRYDLHPLLSQFAQEKLALIKQEQAQTQEKHVEYFLELAEQAEPRLIEADQTAWLERLDLEHNNLRAALMWAEEHGRHYLSLKLSGALFRFWSFYGYAAEGRGYLIRALMQPEAERETIVRAKALTAAGMLASQGSDSRTAYPLIKESVALSKRLGDKRSVATSLVYLSTVVGGQGDYVYARTLLQEGLAVFEDLEDRWGIAWSLLGLGHVARVLGDYPLARSLFEESLTMRRQLGDRWGIAQSLTHQGGLSLWLGEYSSASRLFREALNIQRELNHKAGTALSLLNLGRAARKQGRFASARLYVENGLEIFREIRDTNGVALSLECLGHLAEDQNDHDLAFSRLVEALLLFGESGRKESTIYTLEGIARVMMAMKKFKQAVRILGGTAVFRQTMKAPLPASDYPQHKIDVASTRAQLPDDTFSTLWAEGQNMSMEEMIAYVLHAKTVE